MGLGWDKLYITIVRRLRFFAVKIASQLFLRLLAVKIVTAMFLLPIFCQKLKLVIKQYFIPVGTLQNIQQRILSVN